MGKDERAIQEALAGFVASVQSTSPMIHAKPRLVHQQAQLGMEMWGQKNHLEMFYASEFQEVGNEYDWHNKKTIKVNIIFNDMFVDIEVSGLEYDPENLPILSKFLEANNIKVIQGGKEETEEEVVMNQLKNQMGGGGPAKRHYFIIDGIFIYKEALIKECIMAIDNQLNDYSEEGAI